MIFILRYYSRLLLGVYGDKTEPCLNFHKQLTRLKPSIPYFPSLFLESACLHQCHCIKPKSCRFDFIEQKIEAHKTIRSMKSNLQFLNIYSLIHWHWCLHPNYVYVHCLGEWHRVAPHLFRNYILLNNISTNNMLINNSVNLLFS